MNDKDERTAIRGLLVTAVRRWKRQWPGRNRSRQLEHILIELLSEVSGASYSDICHVVLSQKAYREWLRRS